MTPYSKAMSVGDYRKLANTNKNTKGTKKQSRTVWFYQSGAWKWFRRYVITFYCDPKTMTVPDFTNNRNPLQMKGKGTHVGHYVKVFNGSNTNMNTAFDFRNALPQNGRDNVYSGGKQDEMSIQIDSIHGEGTSKELVSKSKQWIKYTDYDLEQISDKYKELTHELSEAKNIKFWWR
jgi:hypothetical protein